MKNNIKNERKVLGLTQKDLADKFNQFLAENEIDAKPVSYATISRWESGENDPKTDTWSALASFFKVSVSYLQGQSSERITDEVYITNFLNNVTFSEDNDMDKKIKDGLGDMFYSIFEEVTDLKRQLDEHEHPENYYYDD
ncbi:helix-turn-helix transcriptional regulator [Pediococcus pentosaceus]|uniref:helix-turn-helix domain-containing protein n=1 Tax=Pediococcus pentosaceus TaxID=1255 RepID=UPI00316288E2